MTSNTLSRLTRVLIAPRTPLFRPVTASRPFTSLSARLEQDNHPQKQAQHDREKMDTQPNEHTKSGTDSEAAANEDAAFNPNVTDPQEAKERAGRGNEGNPLETSPANPEISKHTDEVKSGSDKKISEGGGGRQGGGEGREREG